jgi:hypothetical protein
VAGSCVYGYETLDATKGGKFLDHLWDYQIVKESSPER